MKKQIIFLILVTLTMISCGMQRKTMIKMDRMVPTSTTVTKMNPDSTTITTKTTTTLTKQTVIVEASSESPLGMGYVPNLPEMAHYIATDANAKVSYAMAAAIDKDPANIRILESVPNPNNLNDQRQILHYKGMPYHYSNNRRSIWYGSQTNGRWIPTRTFQAYMARGEKPPVF